MIKRAKFISVLASVVATSMLLTACGGSSSTGGTAVTPANSKIVIVQSSDALFLDPQGQDEGPTNSVNSNIYDGLVNRTSDLKFVPGLAEKWAQKDNLTWDFNLRKNVTFHNGDPLTADDVVFTIERQKKSKVTASIVNIIDTVKKIDDNTVEIKTKAPYAALLNDLAKVMIIDKKYVTQVGDEKFNLQPIGTGPYKVKEWIKEDHITLEAYDKYWNGSAEIKEVIFRPISNEATRTAALLSGDVNLAVDIPVRDADKVKQNDKLQLLSRSSLRLIYLTLDITRDKTPAINLPTNPLKNEKVRQALQLGIDSDAIVKNIMNGHAYVAYQGNPKEVVGYVDGITGEKSNPEKAKQLLVEAGYPNGFTVTLDASNDRYPNDSQVAQAVASQLAKIGIDVKVNLMPKSNFFGYIRPGDKTSICLVGWSSDTGDTGNWYQTMFYSLGKKDGLGTSNRGHYSSNEFDSTMDKAYSTASTDERTKYLQQATQILKKDMPFIPLYFQEASYGATKNITFTPRMDDYIYAYDIHLKK